MLRKLKIKFVLINLCLAGVVLLLVFFVSCFNTYNQEKEEVNRSLDMAVTDTLSGKSAIGEIGVPPAGREGRTPDSGERRAAKPFRYATVVALVTEGEDEREIIRIDNRNAFMNETTLKEAVATALEQDEDRGRLSQMELFYRKKDAAKGVQIAFADTTDFDAAMKQMILTALILFLLGMAALFLISVLLARIAVVPVKKAWQQQRRFVADASHELKTPLTVILANHEIMLSAMEDETGKQKKWLESSREEAIHMKALIDNLLFLARADEDAEGRRLVKSRLSLSELMLDVSLQFEPILFEAGISLDTKIEDEVYMECDATQMKQLLHILLDNAAKYTLEKGQVFVGLEKSGRKIRLSVANTGETIKQEELEHFFERFYRSDEARTSEGGYGLGLCIAKTIVEDHGGTIQAESGRLCDLENFRGEPARSGATGTMMTVAF